MLHNLTTSKASERASYIVSSRVASKWRVLRCCRTNASSHFHDSFGVEGDNRDGVLAFHLRRRQREYLPPPHFHRMDGFYILPSHASLLFPHESIPLLNVKCCCKPFLYWRRKTPPRSAVTPPPAQPFILKIANMVRLQRTSPHHKEIF